MINFRLNSPPALPSRDFPLVLRQEWRCDGPNPKLGRLRALALIAAKPKAERPAPYPVWRSA